VLAACATRQAAAPDAPAVAEPAPVERYFPLTKRSRWTYRVQELRKNFDYVNRVRVFGPKFFESMKKEVVEVEESYSSTGNGVFLLEEQEPIVYFRENGYLNRVFLTQQGGKLVPASGSGDSRFLPEIIVPGSTWDSDSQAFRVGTDLGFKVAHRHTIALEEQSITVPAGTFEDCLRIDTFSTHGPGSGRLPDEELTFYYSDWYAPGVGLVRTQQWDDAEHAKERTRIELVDYKVESATDSDQAQRAAEHGSATN
ncbi:MAG: TapB family protein, partial [Candidatus Binatia bacterium]